MSDHEFAGNGDLKVGWRDYVDSIAAEKQRALDAALGQAQVAVTKAETATERIAARAMADQQSLREEMNDKLDALRREFNAATGAQKEAVIKAEVANEKRFEAANEWRQQSADRERSQIEDRNTMYASFVPREVWETQHESVIRQLSVLQTRFDTSEGRQTGVEKQSEITWARVLGIALIVAMLVGTLVGLLARFA